MTAKGLLLTGAGAVIVFELFSNNGKDVAAVLAAMVVVAVVVAVDAMAAEAEAMAVEAVAE